MPDAIWVSTPEVRIPGNLGQLVTLPGVHKAGGGGSGLPLTLTWLTFSPLFPLPSPHFAFCLGFPLSLSLSPCPPSIPPQVFLTATHSHGSPFDVLEGYICPVLFGAAWGDDHYHDNHGGSHGGSHGGGGPGSPHSALPAKSKEELSEGSRKKKTKKAD